MSFWEKFILQGGENMPNLREKTWTPTTPAKTEDANFWEDHLIDDESYEGLQNLLEGGGAGHEIQDADGNTMPQQPVIQFINAEVTNGDGKTIVSGNGQRGPKGDPGDGVPSGGTAGQVLTKTATGTAWQTPQGGGSVDSVNGQTGTVVLDASDVGALPDTTTAADLGAYVKPSGGIPKSDLASAVQTSLSKADSALQTAPVTSVNTKTGAVTLTANDVGALPSTYTAPVQSVDGQTGAVQIMPSGGTAGQVLTKTATGTAWQTGAGVSISASDNAGVCKIGGLLIQWGMESITPTANTPTAKAITFAEPYAAKPSVMVTGLSAVPGTTVQGVAAANITTTGATLYVTRTNTTATYVEWLAVGQAA